MSLRIFTCRLLISDARAVPHIGQMMLAGSVLELSKESRVSNNEPELPLEKPMVSSTPADQGDSGPITHLFQPPGSPGRAKRVYL